MLCLLLLAANLGCGSDLYAGDTEAAAAAASKTFSVTAYGAIGDGINDDAPAIERAMQAAAVAGGGQVTFPCGEFAVNSLQGGAPGARSALYIAGATGVQLVGQGHCSHVFTALPQKSLFEFAHSQQIVVTQLHLAALNAAYVETYGMDGGSAVRFTGVSSGSISSVEVDGASAGALYLTAGTSHITVTKNYVHNTYGAAIWEDDCGASSATSCAPSLPPSYNVYSGNTVTDTAFTMYSAISVDDGNGVSNAVIQNNVISWTRLPPVGNGQDACIGVNNASNVSVLNNTCTMAPWNGIIVTTGPGGLDANITVQGNTITSPGQGPVAGDGITAYNGPQGKGLTGLVLAYNTISHAAANGIELNDAAMRGAITGGQAVNNTITMVDQRSPGTAFGIDVEYGGAIAVSGNQIQCNGQCIAAGVNVNHSNGTQPAATDNSVVNILGVPLRIH
jgi:hypothetical protein